jgi:hypothetical protein
METEILPSSNSNSPLNKAGKRIYNKLKRSFQQIKLHQEGKIDLKTIEEVIGELQAEEFTEL